VRDKVVLPSYMCRGNDDAVCGAQGHPTVRITFDNMEGRGAMTKTPSSLQDLRRRIDAKAQAEPSWRFWGLEVGLPCPLCMSLSSNLLCPRKRHSGHSPYFLVFTGKVV
jgi:hypothetical protein